MTTGSARSRGNKYSLEELEMAIAEFNSQYPDEDASMRFIFRVLKEQGVCCPRCGCAEFDDTSTNRFEICRQCRKVWWKTAKTGLQDVRNVREWHCMLWLIEHGVSFNAHVFAKLLEIGSATSHVMLKKIKLSIAKMMTPEMAELPSRLFAGIVGRRTRETPAQLHPRTEEDEAKRRATEKARKSGLAEFDLDFQSGSISDSSSGEVDRQDSRAVSQLVSRMEEVCASRERTKEEELVLGALSHKPMHFDAILGKTGMDARLLLNSLCSLEIDGLAVCKLSDWFMLTPTVFEKESDHEIPLSHSKGIEDFVEFITASSSRIGRKYLQLYLALHWCFSQRERWAAGKLTVACLRSGPVPETEIRQYSTGLMVLMSCN